VCGCCSFCSSRLCCSRELWGLCCLSGVCVPSGLLSSWKGEPSSWGGGARQHTMLQCCTATSA
jgi:hypothetical protein